MKNWSKISTWFNIFSWLCNSYNFHVFCIIYFLSFFNLFWWFSIKIIHFWSILYQIMAWHLTCDTLIPWLFYNELYITPPSPKYTIIWRYTHYQKSNTSLYLTAGIMAIVWYPPLVEHGLIAQLNIYQGRYASSSEHRLGSRIRLYISLQPSRTAWIQTNTYHTTSVYVGGPADVPAYSMCVNNPCPWGSSASHAYMDP